MSNDSEAEENLVIEILEAEGKILNAQAVKNSIRVRVAKRERDNQRDRDHIALQDKIVADCTVKVMALKEKQGGEK